MAGEEEVEVGKGQEALTGIMGMLPSLIGLGTGIATAIPGLKKPKKTTTSRNAAGEAASSVGRAAVGASQTGFGATRGLNLRTGLRQASQVAKETGGTMARAGDLDEQRYQRQLLLRNNRLAEFGMDAADMTAQFGQSVADAKAAKDLELNQKAAQLAELPDVPQYDLGGGPTVDPYTQTIQEGEAGLQRLQGAMAENYPASDFPRPEQGGAELRNQLDVDPLEAFFGVPDKKTIYRAAPELQLQHSLENLALQEVERQGLPLARVYARIQRLQNLPAIRATQERLELEAEFQEF